ncbi:MAG: aminotransferase class V-fold PLP-dependent enzyme [Polyangia bacterium]
MSDTERTSVLDHPRLRYLRRNVLGREAVIDTPFGPRRRVYFDYVASGLPFAPIEDLLAEQVLPQMANTHTESNSSGRRMTHLVEQANRTVGESLGAREDDVVIFTGAGSTAAINRLILAMGLRVPSQLEEVCGCTGCIPPEHRPIIFRSMMEHHSNDISWRETIGETRFVGFDKAGRVDWRDLERQLRSPEVRDRGHRIGTFSAASNVTGILNDVDSLAEVMHASAGYAFFDYAAAAPYVPIDLHPPGGEERRKDAVFISTHKFLGGPQTPGVLAANRELFTSDVPVEPGGGTVTYTSPWEHRYVADVRAREGGGTPPIVQIIRAGLVFQVKRRAGEELLLAAETELTRRARERILANPRLELLGDPGAERLGVFSVVLDGGELHHNLAVRLLNDRFGIQVRAGCMCAGTYGHELLRIDRSRSEQILDAIERGEMSTKPGWLRISLSPATDPDELDYLLDALDTVVADWRDWADSYRQDEQGEFFWKGDDFVESFDELRLPDFDTGFDR